MNPRKRENCLQYNIIPFGLTIEHSGEKGGGGGGEGVPINTGFYYGTQAHPQRMYLCV